MKKLRIYLFAVMIILAAVCLTSCSGIERAFLSTAPDSNNDIAGVTAVPDIAGGEVKSVNGDLVYLRTSLNDKKTHTVYNARLNSKLYSLTSKDGHINLSTLTVEGDKISFFISEDYEMKKSYLYNAKGELVASLEVDSYFETEADLIRFGEKCYRADKDGNITYAFDYPSISVFPDGLTKYGDCYYHYADKSLCVYDEKLGFVSKYNFPTYAENIFYTILENGNALIQYSYPCDTNSDDYDVILDNEKHRLVTELFKIESAKAKHISCDYILRYANNLLINPKNSEESGIDPSVYPVMGEAFSIKDKQVDRSSLLIYIKNNGKVKEFDKVNGSPVTSVTRLDTNRFIVGTNGHRYLMDETGKILGDITNSTVYGRYLTNSNDWNIYDSDLKPVYNYGDKSYSVKSLFGDNLILQSHLYGQNNAIFTGSSDVKEYPDESKKLCSVSDNFYICKDEKINSMYYVYDQQGECAKSIAGRFDPYVVAKTDGAVLLRCDANYASNGDYYIVTFE